MSNDNPKIHLGEALLFAEFALNDAALRESIQNQIDKLTPATPSEERDLLTGKTRRLVRDYLDRNGIHWRFHAGYNDALAAVTLVLRGKTETTLDPEAVALLKMSPFIESDKYDA